MPTPPRTGPAVLLPALLSTALLGVGCVSQTEADRWRSKSRITEEQLLEMDARLQERDAEIALLRGRTNPNPALEGRLGELEAQNQQLRDSLRAAEEQLADSGPIALPARLTSELEQLASANPDLMTFDSKTGLIRFRSDVTFALGKTDLRPAAEQLIGQLAGVLTGPAARSYEVRVVGHTDNVPVRNAANRQKFEDNWGLSAFRAKRVMEALRQAGVQEARMSIAGYGQQRPVTQNGQRGAEANRRVELYLVPMSATAAPPAAGGSTNASATSPAPAPPADVEGAVDPAPASEAGNTPAMFK